jgi:hypothetical protein
MGIQLERCSARSRLVGELVEKWKLEHEQAMMERDTEDIANAAVAECIDLMSLVKRTWRSTIGDSSKNVFDPNGHGDRLKAIIADTIAVVRKSEESLIKPAEQLHNTIAGVEEFRNLRDEFDAIQTEAEELWPKIDEDMVRRSRADFAKGDYRLIEELIADEKGDRS